MGVYGEEEQESMATSDNPVRKRIWDEMIRSNELPGNQIWNFKKMFKYRIGANKRPLLIRVPCQYFV